MSRIFGNQLYPHVLFYGFSTRDCAYGRRCLQCLHQYPSANTRFNYTWWPSAATGKLNNQYNQKTMRFPGGIFLVAPSLREGLHHPCSHRNKVNRKTFLSKATTHKLSLPSSTHLLASHVLASCLLLTVEAKIRLLRPIYKAHNCQVKLQTNRQCRTPPSQWNWSCRVTQKPLEATEKWRPVNDWRRNIYKDEEEDGFKERTWGSKNEGSPSENGFNPCVFMEKWTGLDCSSQI